MNKLQFLPHFFYVIFLFISDIAFGQVTIGSGLPPNPGALLDLKENTDGTSTKGLGMPRVKIQAINSLKPTLPSHVAGTTNAEHVGLIVYHVSGEAIPQCANMPDGLYVWTGDKWERIGKPETVEKASIQIDGAAAGLNKTIDIPSGHDFRGMQQQSFRIDWNPADSELTYTIKSVIGNVNMTSTLPASPLTSSVTQPFRYTPQPMAGITAEKPWASREVEYSFTAKNVCNEASTAKLIFNQTNYAMKINGQYDNQQVIAMDANYYSKVETNAIWKATKNDPNGVLVSTNPLLNGINGGSDRKDGGYNITNFSYTTTPVARYYTADITFADAVSTKRFDDITISVLNCNIDAELSMNDWALRLGFTQAQINSISAGGTYSTALSNGIMLHKDQNGNIFFSGLFGTARWMLNNLAATSYAGSGNPHKSLTKTIDYNTDHTGNNSPDHAACEWGYPNKSESLFNTAPRIGLLYTWAAASAGKGGSTGSTDINDGENVNTNPTRVQGICPNGWHLPSDIEFTRLEQHINNNLSTYSSFPSGTIGGSIVQGNSLSRGSNHGAAMKDICPVPGVKGYTNAKSNILDKNIKPGFNWMLVGRAFNGSQIYGETAAMWTASASGTHSAWYRRIDFNEGVVRRNQNDRAGFMSVRCVQN